MYKPACSLPVLPDPSHPRAPAVVPPPVAPGLWRCASDWKWEAGTVMADLGTVLQRVNSEASKLFDDTKEWFPAAKAAVASIPDDALTKVASQCETQCGGNTMESEAGAACLLQCYLNGTTDVIDEAAKSWSAPPAAPAASLAADVDKRGCPPSTRAIGGALCQQGSRNCTLALADHTGMERCWMDKTAGFHADEFGGENMGKHIRTSTAGIIRDAVKDAGNILASSAAWLPMLKRGVASVPDNQLSTMASQCDSQCGPNDLMGAACGLECKYGALLVATNRAEKFSGYYGYGTDGAALVETKQTGPQSRLWTSVGKDHHVSPLLK